MSQKSEKQITEEIFDEVKNFKGEFKDTIQYDGWNTEMLNEEFVFELNDIEKTYVTIRSIRADQLIEITERVCGKKFSAITPENLEEYGKIFNEKATDADNNRVDEIENEIGVIGNLLWDSIFERMGNKYDKNLDYEVRPGWKVFSGLEKE